MKTLRQVRNKLITINCLIGRAVKNGQHTEQMVKRRAELEREFDQLEKDQILKNQLCFSYDTVNTK